jgi:hypothetical protein
MSQMMENLGKRLNLKPHAVGTSSDNMANMYVGFDVEGHLGEDKRYYLVDTTRLMPPLAPDSNAKGKQWLYRFVRAEFLRSYPVPLSSNAFCKLAANAEVDNQEVKDATQRLVEEVLPQFLHEVSSSKKYRR